MTDDVGPIGRHGVCHLLADTAMLRPMPLQRSDAVEWAVTMAFHVARHLESVTLDPVLDLQAYLARFSLADEEKCRLPGTPCEQCVAEAMVPMYAASVVVELADCLRCDPGDAFKWASRIGAIVLSNLAADRATTPTDALAAFILGAYTRSRSVDCVLATETPR